LSRSKLADNSDAYLVAKRVQPCGDLCQWRGSLVIPLRDVDGTLHSLQFIDAQGEKKFLPGGRVAGCFFALPDSGTDSLVICEGYATAASITDATGLPAVAAMNCGNLLAVATALRAQFPQRDIIIAGDNDQFTENNPGVAKATAAAKGIRARLAVPQFLDTATQPTDFNDLAKLEGISTVKAQIEKATTPKETDEEIYARLAKLPPAQYDRQRQSEAERLGIRVTTLDAEVDARRPSARPLQGSDAGIETITPWDHPITGAELLDTLRATYRRFMVLPAYADVLLAVWTLHTYIFDKFSFTPFLAFPTYFVARARVWQKHAGGTHATLVRERHYPWRNERGGNVSAHRVTATRPAPRRMGHVAGGNTTRHSERAEYRVQVQWRLYNLRRRRP